MVILLLLMLGLNTAGQAQTDAPTDLARHSGSPEFEDIGSGGIGGQGNVTGVTQGKTGGTGGRSGKDILGFVLIQDDQGLADGGGIGVING